MTAKHFIENNIYILHLLAQARSKMLATVLPQDLNKYQSGILSLKKTPVRHYKSVVLSETSHQS